MKIETLCIPEVLLITPKVFYDDRGFFMESWNKNTFTEFGLDIDFVQDNHSKSQQNVLRGLHYQIYKPQGKLIRVVSGKVFDVAVDLRRSSPYFGKWVGAILSADNYQMLYIPPGFAHGFYVLSGYADFLYKTTEFYMPKEERCVIWNDPTIAIKWPLFNNRQPTLTNKDTSGLSLLECETFQ